MGTPTWVHRFVERSKRLSIRRFGGDLNTDQEPVTMIHFYDVVKSLDTNLPGLQFAFI